MGVECYNREQIPSLSFLPLSAAILIILKMILFLFFCSSKIFIDHRNFPPLLFALYQSLGTSSRVHNNYSCPLCQRWISAGAAWAMGSSSFSSELVMQRARCRRCHNTVTALAKNISEVGQQGKHLLAFINYSKRIMA